MLSNNFLITGGSGFIGSNFIKRIILDKTCKSVVNIDSLNYGKSFDNLKDFNNKKYVFYKGNINNNKLISKILNNHKINIIVNFAAESHVDKSIKNPNDFLNANIKGTLSLLNSFKNLIGNKKKSNYKFIHISTDEVYGSLNKKDLPFSEENQYLPNSPYAASKASSDHFVRAYLNTFNLPTIITNCSNNYGPNQYPEKLIPMTIHNCIFQKPIPIYGDGSQIRDWLHVYDHCDAIRRIISSKIIGEKFNIGGNCEITNLSLVKNICKIMDKLKPLGNKKSYLSLIKFVSDRPGHDKRYAINSGKISKKLNWKPMISMDKGLKQTIEWYLKNMNWIKKNTNSPKFQTWVKDQYANKLASK